MTDDYFFKSKYTLRASSTPIALRCYASEAYKHLYRLKSEESEASKRGTYLHKVMASVLKAISSSEKPFSLNAKGWSFINSHLEKHFCCGEEDTHALLDMIVKLFYYLEGFSKGDKELFFTVEEQLKSKRNALSGTPDLVMCVNEKDFIIVDFKFGHLSISAVDNYQLFSYAVLVQEYMQREGSEGDVHLAICQPYRPISSVEFSPYKGVFHSYNISLFMDWIREVFEIDSEETKSEEGFNQLVRESEVLGPHCKYCLAKHLCSKYLKLTDERIAELEEPRSVSELPDSHLVHHYLTLLDLEKRSKVYSTEIKKRLDEGKIMPVVSYKPGAKRRVWLDKSKAMQLFSSVKHLDVTNVAQLPAPNVLKNFISRTVDEDKQINELFTLVEELSEMVQNQASIRVDEEDNQ